MPRRSKRLWSYLFLALAAYAVAVTAGTGPAFMVFLAGGAVLELMFWVALIRRLRDG